MGHPFFLKEGLTDNPWLFKFRYEADIVSEMNEVSLSLQGKQLTVFVAKDKMEAFKQK